MLTFIFTIFMFLIFGKILVFAVKAAWGISKIIASVVLLPLFLIGLVAVGLIKIAFPVLLIVGVISLFAPKRL
ncbi:hypothetical protein MR781_01800 [bacterium]|uniref:hypothetical protein n=1 Tax=unclassified Bariatricus TaxID=2677046 RepID=UPI002A2ED15D|nr:hypothetical protein [bacterium]MDY4503425.1 hypothetical protein [Bariatricus sp.]MDY5818221.1 hypothetical protein [Treponema sp.]MDD6514056.1 hypothetical protein [bacterium]MDD7142565.1 hypothetical protein [bacterium]